MIEQLTSESRASAHQVFDELECAIAQTPEPEYSLIHHFADGMYGRELRLKKGTVLTGAIHKTRHINVLAKGKIMISAVGEENRIMEAPACFIAEAGCRRAGLVIEDVVWITFHATAETDLGKIRDHFIEPHDNPKLDYHNRRLK